MIEADPKQSLIEIYTDGACKGNPGPGGWGALLYDGAQKKELFGGEESTTNNRMELRAVIEALASLPPSCNLVLYTDSRYVKNGIESWIVQWKRNGWKTAAKRPVKNKDLWQRLDAEVQRHQVHWRWLKSHVGHIHNERADQLANLGVQSTLQ